MTLVVLALLAQFGIPPGGNPWWPQVKEPPAQYSHSYHGHLIIKEVSSAEIKAICGGDDTQGCTHGNQNGTCIVYIDSMYHNTVRAAVLRHEIAHCNGWRH